MNHAHDLTNIAMPWHDSWVILMGDWEGSKLQMCWLRHWDVTLGLDVRPRVRGTNSPLPDDNDDVWAPPFCGFPAVVVEDDLLCFPGPLDPDAVVLVLLLLLVWLVWLV